MGAFSKDQFKATTRFDPRIAYACGVAANLAYRTGDEIEQALKNEGFSPLEFRFISDQNTDTQVFVACDNSKVIVSFRGTESTADKLTDANILQTQCGYDGGLVHYGFYQALLYVWDEVVKAINEFDSMKHLDECNRPVRLPTFFTGHSLGAALATLAAFHFYHETRWTPSVYTFGSPRVGNSAFADAYDRVLKRTTFRYVNDMDVVVYMPPEMANYDHVGYGVYFDNDGGVSTKVSYWERVATRALQFWERDMVGLDSEWTKDHSMGNEYVPNLRRNVDTPLSFK